ncbi:MAG: uroporphyrinogen-III C-methyltransferase [Gammaproteobacteria bacterium]
MTAHPRGAAARPGAHRGVQGARDEPRIPSRQALPGLVSLVGAGPGDPDLLTLRALRALETADYVLHDRLVAPGILALLPCGTPREYAGKGAGESAHQAAINTRLVQLARRYRRVVRLKGGDPFVFGRGAEEALALAAAGIPYEVIPGITAAIGCGAYAGIPLTHRGVAQQVTFVTAHRADGDGAPDWAALAGTGRTLVFYMGVGEIEAIERALLGQAHAPATPIAFIENGCTPRQRVFRGTLAGMSALAARVALAAPALIVVGDVTALGLVPAVPGEAPGPPPAVTSLGAAA